MMTLGSVLDVMRAVAGIRERRELLDTLINALRSLIPADWYLTAVRRGRDADEVDVYSCPEIPGLSSRVRDYAFQDDIALTGRAELMRLADIANLPSHAEMWRRVGVQSSVRVPLIVEGGLVGAMACWSRDPNAFDDVDLDIVSHVGRVSAVVIDSCLAYERVAQLRDEADDANSYLREALANARQGVEGMVGEGPAFTAVRRQIEVVAATDATVLLTGESGTGKDVVARAIHTASNRRDRPLVTVNCAVIPEGLAESELFGHEEGAFTGAERSRMGRFEQADGGTLFLDEIGELSLEVQAKLLRVLQEREVERVGGGEPITIDVRIIAATNRSLAQLIEADQFREDLFFRLAVFPIHLPPLRSRLEDLPALVEHFVHHAADRLRMTPPRVTSEVIRRLADHDWPGNIRELQHAIERAMIVSGGGALSIDAIVPRRIVPISSDSLRNEYLAALQATKWVIEGVEGAAAQLGLHPNTLRHRLKRMGIARPPAR
jgi:transcriptional regulator with GAF, ATPase, and Fis domain